MLEEEQARLIASRFGAVRDEQYQKELLALQQKISALELCIADHIKEKADLNAMLQNLSGMLFSRGNLNK